MFSEQIIPVGDWAAVVVDYLVEHYRFIFQWLKLPVEFTLQNLEHFLKWMHPLAIIAVVVLIGWRLRGWGLGLLAGICFTFIGLIGLWAQAMTTMAMVLAAVIFCALAGLPLGVVAGRSDRFEMMIRPVLDAMQTTPAFVYLVPIVMLFSVGDTAGVLATIIFALPPLIRLTSLGLRQVDRELVEAANAFGASRWQTLMKVQIPLALPTILAGLNQTIMMSLSMVVIAALIGAGGLGDPVNKGLNTLDIAGAVSGGLGIVLMAVALDRLTQAVGTPREKRKA